VCVECETCNEVLIEVREKEEDAYFAASAFFGFGPVFCFFTFNKDEAGISQYLPNRVSVLSIAPGMRWLLSQDKTVG
jgi:hypothetical protein